MYILVLTAFVKQKKKMRMSLQENGPAVQLAAGLCNLWKVDLRLMLFYC